MIGQHLLLLNFNAILTINMFLIDCLLALNNNET